jgi:predicted PurR-regulated permease PerM
MVAKTDYDSVTRFFISIIGIVFISVILIELKEFLIPFVFSIFLLFLFDSLHQKLKTKRIPIGIALVLDLLIIGIVIFGISQFIIGSFNQFSATVPLYEQKFDTILNNLLIYAGIKNFDISQLNVLSIVNQLNLDTFASGILSSTLNVATTTILIILFYIFIVLGHENMQEAFRKRIEMANLKAANNHSNLLESWDITYKKITQKIQHYFSAKFLLSIIVAIGTGIILWLFNIHFVVVWMILAMLLYFVPTIGPAVAVLFPTVISIIQYESAGYTLFLLLALVGIQTLVGNVIEPIFLGERLNMNPLVILLSLFIWGYIWGIIGMLLAVPIMSIFQIIFSLSKSPNLQFISALMGSGQTIDN